MRICCHKFMYSSNDNACLQVCIFILLCNHIIFLLFFYAKVLIFMFISLLCHLEEVIISILWIEIIEQVDDLSLSSTHGSLSCKCLSIDISSRYKLRILASVCQTHSHLGHIGFILILLLMLRISSGTILPAYLLEECLGLNLLLVIR